MEHSTSDQPTGPTDEPAMLNLDALGGVKAVREAMCVAQVDIGRSGRSMAEAGRGMTLSIAVGDWVLVDDARGNPTIQRVDALVVDDFGPHLRLHNDDDPPPGHVIRLDPFPADADEPDWFHDSIGNRWVGPVGDGTIVVEIFGDELALLQAAVRQAADFPVAHVELFTDTTGDHRWRAVARNGEIVATSGEGYRNAAHARAMAERILPGVGVRDEGADRG